MLASIAWTWVSPSQLLDLVNILVFILQVSVHIFPMLYNSLLCFSVILYKLIITSSSVHPCSITYGNMKKTFKSEILLNEGTEQHLISAIDREF